MEVYSIDDDRMSQIPESPVEYETDLQTHLLKAQGAEIGELEMLYISQEGTADEEGGIFDILAVNEDGDTIIVELKRGNTPRQVVSQALEYASGIRTESYERLDDRFRRFRRSRGKSGEQSLREAHAEFFRRDDDPLEPEEFNDTVHLVIVAAEFGGATLNMADLLREHDLDVVCVRYQTFADSERALTLLTTESVRRLLALEPGGADDAELTETEAIQREFWSQLTEKIDRRMGPEFRTDAVKPRSYLPVKGTLPDGASIALGTDSLQGQIQVKLHLRDEDTGMWNHLETHKSDIEAEIGEELIWDAESARYEHIRLVRSGNITTEQDRWDEFHTWLLENWETFDSVFGSYLRRQSAN